MKQKYNLKQLQVLPLDAKISWTITRIRRWYEHWKGQIYLSWSGGLDSTVLKHIFKQLYPDVPCVFVNTTNEFPGILKFINKSPETIVLLPKINYKQVTEKRGYPIGSKKIARFIRDLQNPTEKNKATRRLRLTGLNRKDEYLPSMKLPKKWIPFVDSGIKISEECCNDLKKKPLDDYAKLTGRKPITGVMACESNRRGQDFNNRGCSLYDAKKPISHPLSIWTQQDILRYIKKFNVDYCEEYGDICEKDGKLYTTDEVRTGCIFCPFGVQMENRPNRFDRLKEKYPKLYNYCWEKLNYKEILPKLQKQFVN